MRLTMRRCVTTKNGTFGELDCQSLGLRGRSSEQDLQRQLALTKNQLRDLRMSHESNQAKLLDHTQRQGMWFATEPYFFISKLP